MKLVIWSFPAYIRWFPDRVIVVFKFVENDAYMLVMDVCFFINTLTVLYVKVPSGEAE